MSISREKVIHWLFRNLEFLLISCEQKVKRHLVNHVAIVAFTAYLTVLVSITM